MWMCIIWPQSGQPRQAPTPSPPPCQTSFFQAYVQFSMQKCIKHLEGGDAWVALWHTVSSSQLPDNHFKTPVKFANKLFAKCQSNFTSTRFDFSFLGVFFFYLAPCLFPCFLPPLSMPHTSVSDLTAAVLNFLPGYFQRIHLVLLEVRDWWEESRAQTSNAWKHTWEIIPFCFRCSFLFFFFFSSQRTNIVCSQAKYLHKLQSKK